LIKRFYSNGKLLITGEYVVLDGAKAFALPTKMGQDLIVSQTSEINTIVWKSFDFDQSVWFEANLNTLEIFSQKFKDENEGIAKVLQNILFEAHQLNPIILPNKGFLIETNLTFPRFWGLGTSSTLINNIAQWFEIDAFVLLKNSFGGSGYDIACAQNNSPILYSIVNEKPVVEPVDFKPNFHKHLYFLYLNKKQNSKAAIATYYSKHFDIAKTKTALDSISKKICKAQDLSTFEMLLHEHEALLSDVLEMETVKEHYFSDFEGTIKSLGAWGGDFVLVTCSTNPQNYFANKGFTTLLSYHEMIL